MDGSAGIGRLQHIALGALAGLVFWVLTGLSGDLAQGRVHLGLTVLAAAFFGTALAMVGQMRPRLALAGAAAVAVPVALLMVVDSFSFADAGAFLGAGHPVVAGVILAALPVPFLMAMGQHGAQGWRDYAALFVNSWNIVVRYAAAALFLGFVWVVLWLLAALLNLVGITLLDRLLGEAPVVWVLSGAVLGLGLSVVTEMSDLISAQLLLRLLRLLLPVVLGVVAVFVLVLPIRGLTALFGPISPAGILLAVAAAAISLIAIAVDQDDVEAAHAPVLTLSARALALLLPVLGGLSAWALALQVAQQGWTPGRVAGAAAAAAVLGYAGLYALAVLTGRGWMGWVRRGNLAMALTLLAGAALWLTPLITPEAIATRSQLARLEAGRSTPDDLPLWQFAHEWGRPGLAALARLQAQARAPGQEVLARRLAALDQAAGPWDPALDPAQPAPAAVIDAVIDGLAVVPRDRALPEGLLEAVAAPELEGWASACGRRTPQGNPGCLLILADLLPHHPGEEAVVLLDRWGQGLRSAPVLIQAEGDWRRGGAVLTLAGEGLGEAALIDLVLAEGIALVPSGIQAVQAGGQVFTVAP